MLKHITTLIVLTLASTVFVGCATLPSVAHIEERFHREHPSYVVVSATMHKEPSRVGATFDDAVFSIVYRKPGEKRTHTYERMFAMAAEAWIERPDSPREK